MTGVRVKDTIENAVIYRLGIPAAVDALKEIRDLAR